jgi:hypothetical protein
MPLRAVIGPKRSDTGPYPYHSVKPGAFTPTNVPSQAETDTRFPPENRGFIAWFDDKMEREWRDNARRFESALRDWAEVYRAYVLYEEDLRAWEHERACVEAENERISTQEYPRKLKDFEEEEVTRHALWLFKSTEHEENEKRRHAEWEQACVQHRENEARRLAEWEQNRATHEQHEKQRQEEWEQQRNCHKATEDLRHAEFVRQSERLKELLRERAGILNEFLEEHPDMQAVYKKVDVARDIQGMEERAARGGKKRGSFLHMLEHMRNRGN